MAERPHSAGAPSIGEGKATTSHTHQWVRLPHRQPHQNNDNYDTRRKKNPNPRPTFRGDRRHQTLLHHHQHGHNHPVRRPQPQPPARRNTSHHPPHARMLLHTTHHRPGTRSAQGTIHHPVILRRRRMVHTPTRRHTTYPKENHRHKNNTTMKKFKLKNTTTSTTVGIYDTKAEAIKSMDFLIFKTNSENDQTEE